MKRVICTTVALFLSGGGFGCGSEQGELEQFGAKEALPIVPRVGTVVAETCALDTWQRAALESAPMHAFVREVVFVCPSLRKSGDVMPVDVEARVALATSIAIARALGYKARVGVTMGDDRATFPEPYSSDVTAAAFDDPKWRASVVAKLAPFAAMSDGLELDLLSVPAAARGDVTQLVVELHQSLAAGPPIGVMAPPATSAGDATPGAAAFDLAAIAPYVDRIRMMTLDYSCCATAGPDLDTGWAVDVARYGVSVAGGRHVDVAVPLYGTDFSSLGTRFVSYEEGRAIADDLHVVPERDATGELHFDWRDAAGRVHQTYFEDAVSVSRALHAWDTAAIGPDVGVVLYGLGAEDPATWQTIAGGLP